MRSERRLSKKKEYYKLLSDHLASRDHVFDEASLTEAVKSRGPFSDKLYYSTPRLIRKIYSRAISDGLPFTDRVYDSIRDSRECDYSAFYKELSATEKALLANKVFRISDKGTRRVIRKRLIAYSTRHGLPLSDAAAVFSCSSDCRLGRKRLAYIEKETEKPLTAVITVIPSSELPSLRARMEKLVVRTKDDRMIFGAIVTRPASLHPASQDDARETAYLKEVYDSLTAKHGEIFRFYIPRRIYRPSSRTFECHTDRFGLLFAALSGSTENIEICLSPDSSEEPVYTVLLDRTCEIRADTIDILIRTAMHPLNRTVIEKGVLKSGHPVIFAGVRYYIPVIHTLFSYISAPFPSIRFAGASSVFDPFSPSPGKCAIVDNESFMLLYGKKNSARLLRAPVSGDAIVFEKRNFSPASEISETALSLSKPRSRAGGALSRAAGTFFKVAMLLTPLTVLAAIALFPLFGDTVGGILLALTLGLYNVYVCYPLIALRSDPARSHAFGAVSATLRRLCYLSFIPAVAFINLFYSISGLYSSVMKKEMRDKRADAAKTFFAITVFSLGTGILFLTFSDLPIHRTFAFFFLIAPVVVVMLSLERGGGRKKRSRILDEHCARAVAAYRTYGMRSGVFSEDGAFESKTVSAEDMGLYLAASLAFYDLELISPLELYNTLSRSLDLISEFCTSDGLFYSEYDPESKERTPESVISARGNGVLFACLTALREGLRETLDENDSLVVRIDRLIRSADLSKFGDIRLNRAGAEMTAWFLSSCFCGVAGRIDSYVKGPVSLSAHGGFDDPFLPELFLPVYPATDTRRNLSGYYRVNRLKAKKGLWGVSSCAHGKGESGTYEFDREAGIALLACGGCRDSLRSPYASFFSLSLRPAAAVGALYAYRFMRAFGRYGFYDSVSISGENKRVDPEKCYSLYNLCASVIAADNYANNSVFVRRFCRSAFTSTNLYLLRTGYDRTFSHFKAIGREEEDAGKCGMKYRVPRICLLTNGTISAAVSDEGHLMLFSKSGKLTADCFNKYDMGDVSSSFSVICCLDGEIIDAMQGDFSYSERRVRFVSHRNAVITLDISVSDHSPECLITVSAEGTFNRASCALSFASRGVAAARQGVLIAECGGETLVAKIRKDIPSELSTDGRICEISTAQTGCGGRFSSVFSFSLGARHDVGKGAETPVQPRGIIAEAVLASYFLSAGPSRKGTVEDESAFREEFTAPIVSAFPGNDPANPGLIDDLSHICKFMRYAGIDMLFAVFADSESCARSYTKRLCKEDALITGKRSTGHDAKLLSVACFDERAFSSPERFAYGIMSVDRRVPELCEWRRGSPDATAPDARIPQYSVSLLSSSIRKTGAQENAYFSVGGKLRMISDGYSLGGVYYGDVKLTEYIGLSSLYEGVEYDVVSASLTVEKNDCVTVYRTLLGEHEIRTEVFTDDSLPAIIIRTFGSLSDTRLYLVPKAPYDDPRLICEVRSDDAVFYHPVCGSAFPGMTLYCSASRASDNEHTFIIGLLGENDKAYYNSSEKHAYSSGCDTPMPEPRSVAVRSFDPNADHLVSFRIPELLSGFLASTGNEIFGFPALALRDPEALKIIIFKYAKKQQTFSARSLILTAAIAACSSFSESEDFLEARLPYADSSKPESVYAHGLRALEYFMPENGSEDLLRAAVADMYRPISVRMRDKGAAGVYNAVMATGSAYCDDPLINAYGSFMKGDYERGCDLLSKCTPGYCETDPFRLSFYYYVFMFVQIGIEGKAGVIRIKPRLSRRFPEYRLFLRKELTEYAIHASLGTGDLTTLDGVVSDGLIIYDGLSHKLEITVAENSGENS